MTELRILIAGLLDWHSCLLSKLTLLRGISYLFVPRDLIPDRIPIIGHFDEIGFVVASFVGSRYLIPRPSEERYLDLWDARLELSVCPGLRSVCSSWIGSCRPISATSFFINTAVSMPSWSPARIQVSTGSSSR